MIRFALRHAMHWLLCAMLALSLDVHAAVSARAWLDRDTMQLGETVTLNVETHEGSDAQPDFSALKQDFTLLNTQSSRQISVVNGRSESKTLWAVGLEPRREGRLTIAPITVGATRTAPIELTVLAAAAGAQPAAGGDVFLQVDADPLSPYVQQQVRYTVKLYYALELTDGNLAEPQAEGINVTRLGQGRDKSYITTIGARRYHVVERHYALTPERSGEIDIAPLVFRGNAFDTTDPTGFFSRGRRVSARSDAVHLQVRPRPAQWSGANWLPAASLLLQDEGGDLPDEVHVGDPVTRTIRLQAQGLAFEQLPELTLAAPSGAELYPDKSDTRTRDDGEWLYGERVRKFALVPNRPGTLTIPGLKVEWWDTAHDRVQTTELPAKTLRVLPAAAAAAAAAAPPADAAATRTAPAALASAAGAAPAPPAAHLRLWKRLAGAAFALWLITLALWWRTRRAPLLREAPRSAPVAASGQRAAFLRACSLGEFAGAERALVAWARSERADVRNLGELATRLADAAQRDALADLQRTRYAGAASQGLATRLQQAFKGGLVWRSRARAAATESALPALYPERD